MMTKTATIASNSGEAVRLLWDDELEAVSGGCLGVDDILLAAGAGALCAVAYLVGQALGDHIGSSSSNNTGCSKNGGVKA